MINSDIIQAVTAIKSAIQQTRYNVMRTVNKEVLSLYYGVGEYIYIHSRGENLWGTSAIQMISDCLQKEIPGLKGFSVQNMRKMRQFYESWSPVFGKSDNDFEIRSLTTSELDNGIQLSNNKAVVIRSLTTSVFDIQTLQAFLSVQFTHHYELITKTNSIEERLFYIRKIAAEFWSVEKLKYNLKENLYQKEGSMPNNFARTLPDEQHRNKALKAFRDNYLLDFVNIGDPDDWDERRVEDEIVHNIKNFIMALGTDFSFMGNQFRLLVDEQEYFIDLLFFNRRLQSLVAIDLKWTDFKPEYVGKMNFYLSALDDMVRMPYEQPSIGIILCRGQKAKTVEYALRDTNKPMGVATYKAINEMPEEYGNVLSKLEGLVELL